MFGRLLFWTEPYLFSLKTPGTVLECILSFLSLSWLECSHHQSHHPLLEARWGYPMETIKSPQVSPSLPSFYTCYLQLQVSLPKLLCEVKHQHLSQLCHETCQEVTLKNMPRGWEPQRSQWQEVIIGGQGLEFQEAQWEGEGLGWGALRKKRQEEIRGKTDSSSGRWWTPQKSFWANEECPWGPMTGALTDDPQKYWAWGVGIIHMLILCRLLMIYLSPYSEAFQST